jgi:hypothetical protein
MQTLAAASAMGGVLGEAGWAMPGEQCGWGGFGLVCTSASAHPLWLVVLKLLVMMGFV